MRQYLRVKHFYATFRRLNITLHDQNSITRTPNTVFQICVSIFFSVRKNIIVSSHHPNSHVICNSLKWYIYILCVFTEKPYCKPLECNVVYIPIIILSHATSHDFKWRQNKPWLSTIWMDVGDVMTCRRRHDVIDAVPLLAAKTACKCFNASI